MWEAYQENIELVLDVVEPLLDDIDGKTVVSSDHSNLVGDWISPIPCRGYGHPPTIYVNEPVKVPWLTIDGDRREITADPPETHDEPEADVIEDRLSALGYK